MSRRSKRVTKVIRYEISQVLQRDLADPRMGFTTIAKVVLSPDLRKADVYVSIMGSEADISKTFRALKQAERVGPEDSIVLLEIGGNDLLGRGGPGQFSLSRGESVCRERGRA